MPVDDNAELSGVGEDWLLARFALRYNAIGTSRQRRLSMARGE
jgi:hypothetical protein